MKSQLHAGFDSIETFLLAKTSSFPESRDRTETIFPFRGAVTARYQSIQEP